MNTQDMLYIVKYGKQHIWRLKLKEAFKYFINTIFI